MALQPKLYGNFAKKSADILAKFNLVGWDDFFYNKKIPDVKKGFLPISPAAMSAKHYRSLCNVRVSAILLPIRPGTIISVDEAALELPVFLALFGDKQGQDPFLSDGMNLSRKRGGARTFYRGRCAICADSSGWDKMTKAIF